MSDLQHVRNRIRRHVRVRAGELVPHELNPRRHSEVQRQTLLDLYRDIGFARSLLAYELPDGRLKLIDGHLRQSLDPDMVVDVELLDVSDAEARALLLSLDPLAQLVDYDPDALDKLRCLAHTDSDAVANLWASVAQAGTDVSQSLQDGRDEPARRDAPPEQFLILVECDGEAQQAELLKRFRAEGLKCKPLLT